MKFVKKILILFLMMTSAQAESFKDSSATWRVEENNANGIAFINTPARCQDGRIILPGEYSEADRNRFFFIVIAAKKSGAVISINYSVDAGICKITKFAIE